jgi:hypothetical protein
MVKTTGGSVKVVDSRTFNISQTISMAEVTVVPGGMRELHVRSILPWYLVSNAYQSLSSVASYSARMVVFHVSPYILLVTNVHVTDKHP